MSSVIVASRENHKGGGPWAGRRAMVGKELKQNLPVAVVALIAVSIGLVVAATRPSDGPGSFHNYGGFDAIWNAVTLTLTTAGVLVGTLLGLLQIIPEQRRDLWAFLIHRPVTGDTLFVGKVTAGLLLYAGATGLPLFGFALWARTPGHLAGPFDARLTLGALAGILAGVPFYFAALLTALRPARWWASRAVPIPAAIAVAALALGMPELWMAGLVVFIGSAVFALAARGVFLTTGEYVSQPRFCRGGLGTVLYVGLLVVLIALIALGVGIYNTLYPKHYAAPGTTQQYAISDDGQIVLTTVFQGEISEIRALNGAPVRHIPTERTFSWNDLLSPVMVNDPGTVASRLTFSNPERYARSTGAGRTEEQWYYASGGDRLMDYETRTRQLTGEMGPCGFEFSDGMGAGQFPSPLLCLGGTSCGQELLLFAHAQYLADQEKRTITPLHLNLDGRSVTHILPLWSYRYTTDPQFGNALVAYTGPTNFLVIAGSRFLLLSQDGELRFSVPRALPSQTFPWVQAAMTADGKHVFFWYDNANPRLPAQIFDYDGQGHLFQRVSLPPLVYAERVTPTPRYLAALCGVTVPPGISAGYIGLAAMGDWAGDAEAKSVWRSLKHDVPVNSWTQFLLTSILTGIFSSFLAWRIGRRCAFERAGLWVWSVGTFWLGLPGVLLLMSLRDRPAREPCPNCRRLRVVTRDLCEHCGAPFAPPTRDGTEIFEDAGETRAEAATSA